MNNKVLGFGIATIDYIFVVPKFPAPNEKIRCLEFEIQGGGNCANTLTTLSRLGLVTEIITKIGADNIGNQIKESLEKEGISTKYVIQEGKSSPVSTVIVDPNNNTRTIIHKPGLPYTDNIFTDEHVLTNVNLLYLDGRFSESAKILAKKAMEAQIYVVAEAERVGLGVEDLFKYANCVITSENFHTEFFSDTNIEKNLVVLLA